MAMSFSQMFAGRKRESSIWDYYEYDDKTEKSICKVCDATSGRVCGLKLAGKNATNLVQHLSRLHKAQHLEFEAKEKVRQGEKQGSKRKLPDDVEEPPKKLQTMEKCLEKKAVRYSSASSEYKQRLGGIIDFLVETGSPMNIITHPAFHKMINILDSKFAIPGMLT